MVSFNYKSYKNTAPLKIYLEIVFPYVKFSKLNKYLNLLGLQYYLYNLSNSMLVYQMIP